MELSACSTVAQISAFTVRLTYWLSCFKSKFHTCFSQPSNTRAFTATMRGKLLFLRNDHKLGELLDIDVQQVQGGRNKICCHRYTWKSIMQRTVHLDSNIIPHQSVTTPQKQTFLVTTKPIWMRLIALWEKKFRNIWELRVKVLNEGSIDTMHPPWVSTIALRIAPPLHPRYKWKFQQHIGRNVTVTTLLLRESAVDSPCNSQSAAFEAKSETMYVRSFRVFFLFCFCFFVWRNVFSAMRFVTGEADF